MHFNHFFLNGDRILQAGASLDALNIEPELKAFNPDVLILYGYFQKFQRRTHRFAYKNKIQIAYISDGELRHKRKWWKELIKFPFLAWYFSKINYFLTVGNANEAYYNHYGIKANRFISMHFPIDIDLYQHAYQNRDSLNLAIRTKYDLAMEDFVSCVVGKLVKMKNQDHILEAMLLLEEKQMSMALFVIGSGEMETTWKQKAKQLKHSKVFFTGFVKPEELPSYYAASDVYIHPASMEPHSIAVSEAIFMGCPVIISDRCGSYGESDDVQEGKNGWVYKFGEIKQLAGLLEEVLENKDLLYEKRLYSHKIAVQFQNEAHINSLEELVYKASRSEKTGF